MTTLTIEEIVDMARQAGFTSGEVAWHDNMFETFAKLVAEKSASVEREACAKICGRLADEALVVGDEDAVMCFEEAEDLIRTRSKAILRGEA